MKFRDKKHIFVFEDDDGKEMIIATDDVSELLSHEWFSRFVGGTGKQEVKYEEKKVVDMQMVEERAKELAQQMVDTHMQRQQQTQSSQPVQQTRQPQQPVPPRSQPQKPAQTNVRESYVKIPIEQMTDEIWGQMTEDEKLAFSELNKDKIQQQ